MEYQSLEKDNKRLQAKIEEIREKVEKYPKPEELEEIKKEIKRLVPFTRRSYFAAMLLKESLKEREGYRNERKESFQPRRAPKPENKSDSPKKEIKELPKGANTLYLNIGRMKRLNRNEVLSILDKEVGIKREDVYDIKIHDKYSFIILSEENCQKTIDKLNGKEINGRVAQINIAKAK